eukprot:752963-Hanusia_phi.AAC.3
MERGAKGHWRLSERYLLHCCRRAIGQEENAAEKETGRGVANQEGIDERTKIERSCNVEVRFPSCDGSHWQRQQSLQVED